jgi:protein-disulfide isomerase/uncharacterized membrane protein
MEKSSQKKSLFAVALICTIAIIGVFLYLNKHHVELKLGIGAGQSICNVSEKLNCDTAASSIYAEVFGIPIALLGAFTSGLMLVFMLLARFHMSTDTERTERYTFYISTFMVLVAVIMGSISLFILQSACPFCMASYALSLIIWLCLLGAYRPAVRHITTDLKDIFTTEKWVLGTLISVPVLSLLINNMTLDSYGYQEIKRMTQDSLNNWKSAPPQVFDFENGLQFQNGSGPAKVTVVEFADFLCPHCKAAYPSLHNFAKNHPDVKLVFKVFPLDGVCNSVIQHKGDGKRCELAYATFCSEKLAKKGWDAHNYFFDNQESLFAGDLQKSLLEFTKNAGVDYEQLQTCMNSEEVHEQVRKMTSEGEKAQISGTPSIFFNNKVLAGGQVPSVIENTYREFDK